MEETDDDVRPVQSDEEIRLDRHEDAHEPERVDPELQRILTWHHGKFVALIYDDQHRWSVIAHAKEKEDFEAQVDAARENQIFRTVHRYFCGIPLAEEIREP